MARKINSQTEIIEVPIEIADEVKLFINLLQTGEIEGVVNLLQKLNQPKLLDLTINLDNLWDKVVRAIKPSTTQAMVRQQCKLINLEENDAVITVKSQRLRNLIQGKISGIERAFLEVLGRKVTVNLQDRKLLANTSELTRDQQKALSQLKSFTKSQDKFFRLTGYAGTGKSFTICHYIKWLMEQKLSFVASAPTNKAAKNLRKLADSEGLELEVKTVAQLLGQQPELNEDSGKEEFICSGDADLSGYNVVIIDEFSMVNKDNFNEIVTQSRSSLLTKIVFVGDKAQLPPINEPKPIVATSELIERYATLTEVVRYDGELARVAEKIRSDRAFSQRIYPFSTTSDKSILCVPQTEWLDRAISLFESEEYRLNPDYIRFLAWRNKTVDSLNKFVRNRLWGEDVPPFVPGDRLIARKPLFRPKPGAKGKNKWRISINNSEECQVIEAGILSELVFQKQAYRYWQVKVQPEIGKPQILSILHEDSLKLHAEQIKYLARLKQWSYYFDLSRMFDDVGYAYALTTHKAQGSSIDYVFLDVFDMRGCSERQKLQYTALTRAKQQVLIPQ